MFVWVSGCSRYETTGVIHLLEGIGIVGRDFRVGNRLCPGDILILCFSSATLLGWWRYLKIVQWVADRYDVRLIVLCPDKVYLAGVICGRNIVAVNGKHGCFRLSRSLLQAIQRCLPGGRGGAYREYMKSFFLEGASQALLMYPISESDRLTAQRAYHRRSLIVQRLGFASLMTLKVFMAGFVR